MSNLVIVAIPEQDDRVWKISSEKVPHLTLLFLGDAEGKDLEGITQFVQHAVDVSEHGPFYLDVDHRDTLGPDDADVIFFNKRSYNLKWIKQFRNQLLQNGSIRTAYDSVENQYPEWLPHLTLGYPETPAKKLDDAFDDRLYSVNFDRIAVWTGDYEGPEFRLEWPEREDMDMPGAIAYSEDMAQVGADFLEHHGVKGMKWGVRKEKPHGTGVNVAATAFLGPFANLSKDYRDNTSTATKVKTGIFGIYALVDPSVRRDLKAVADKGAVAQADKQWAKDVNSGKAWVAINNASADHFNSKIDALNAKHPDNVNKDWSKDPKYMGDVKKLTAESLAVAANKLQMDNPSGTKKVVAEPTASGMGFTIRVQEVKHAANDEELNVSVKYIYDANGRVKTFTVLDDGELEHSELTFDEIVESGADFLAHHGVKGMKWGVRKERFQSGLHERRVKAEEKTRERRPAKDVRTVASIGKNKRAKATITTKGGHDHPPTEDAIKVAEAKQKLKTSGVHALSNKELKDVQQRLNLENDVSRLMRGQRTAGQRFVDGLLGRGGKEDSRNPHYQMGNSARGLAGPAAATVIKNRRR
jgi:2'-5' RNA ligase